VSASVSFPVTGTIDKIYFSEGQKVKKGDLLAELNSYSLVNAHSAALATLKQAEDAMKRMQMLYDNKSLAEIKYVEVKTKLEKARSSEAIARKNMKDGHLMAPFSGLIGKRMAEVGENILPNESVFTILQINKVKIKIAVPEKEIGMIALGQNGTITVSALNNKSFQGKITERGVVADPISHTYNVRILVDNENGELLPGMVGNVSISNGSEDDILLVPANCVQIDSNGKEFVWKVSEGIAVKTEVEVGRLLDGGVEVVDGLHGGEEIIKGGYQKVVEGIKVKTL
jgi:RND family efflux transporter MFP subunit